MEQHDLKECKSLKEEVETEKVMVWLLEFG